LARGTPQANGRVAPRRVPPFIDPPGYVRHRPEETLLYQLVEQHHPAFCAARETAGCSLPKHVQQEFEAYLKCGRLEHGFLRARCESCHAEKLVAFSCNGRAICPSCGARRMVETAALLVDQVLPTRPMLQWVLSLPFALRFLLARDPEGLTHVLGIVYRAIAGYILEKVRLTQTTGATGAVTLIQRFGSALNANVHFHMLFLGEAMGPRAGQKVFTLRAVPAEPLEEQEPKRGVAQAAGFSLHTGIGIEADARSKLERLCRYV